MLKYLAAIWNKFFSEAKNPENSDFMLPAPLLIVLHNGSKPIINKPMLDEYIAKVVGTKRFIQKFDYIMVDLSVLTPDEFGTAPLLRVILELLKRATDGNVRKQILEPLAAIRDDEKTRYWI
ncbi:MAG: Rpn family recombination-promoting nuclease/putative transposase, partial [Planctomycetaceae bacterium]|nr:Rpn family recombination-promoting nuclease/putative transposase [Planctomycetaceae bacterium]